MALHNDLGYWGEEQAATYLKAKGLKILRRNWQYGHRDLDIVATDFSYLIIVEVKTRRNCNFTEPQEAINNLKIASIRIATEALIRDMHCDLPLRFDIVTVVGSEDGGCKINHIEDAFK